MRDMTQRDRGFRRRVELVIAPLAARMIGLIEWARITGYSTGANAVGTANTDEDEGVRIVEPYGLASQPDGAATGLVLAPGGETQARALIGSVAPAGRPATEAGDTAVWSAAGHLILLDNDGSLKIEAKDGSVIEMTDSGAITVTAGTLASITINVDAGQSVNVGGVSAVELLKAQATETYLVAAANAVTGTPDVEAGFTAFAAALAGLADAAKTQKAKGE